MTGDTTTPQQFIKQRLQKVWNLPENQICSDCSAKRPTWASLIIPPQDAPTELQIIVGAFVCFQCSGIHRGLGTHVCFVRSVNLDDWKEKEVLAMEMGGNDRVNAIFEAKDIHINGVDSIKLDPMADMETRKKFIQDKYVNKKYFNAFYYDRVLRESTRANPNATPTHVEDLHEDGVDHTFDANWDHFEKPNNFDDDDDDDQEEEPTSSSTTTENLETPSAVISSKSQQQQQQQQQQRDRPSRSMSSTSSGDSSTRRRSRSRSQKRRSRSKGGGGGGRRHRSSRQGDDDRDKSLRVSSTHGSTCSSAATSDDDDDDASSFGNDDEPSSAVGGGDKDKKHHHSLGGYTMSSSTQNRSRGGSGGGKPKDPLSVSDHGSVGGGRARMRRQLAAGIKLQRTTSLASFGGGGGGSIGSSGRGGIQLGGDLGDDNNDSNSVSNRRSSSHRRSGGLDSLSVSEHGGSSSGRPRMRRQMSRQRIPTRSKSDFNDSHSLPTIKAGSDGRRHNRHGFGDDDDEEEEEEMVHVIQNPLTVTSEPVLSGGSKKAGASLFGNKNNSRPGMRRQSSSNRLRKKSSLDRSRHSSDLDDDQGDIGKSSSHSRQPMRRIGSIRTKGGERNNSIGSSNSNNRGQKDCFGEGATKSNDEEEEDSELDSDAENDDGDDDNRKPGRRGRTSGSRRGGDGGGGISADRKARSIERARGRERKKSTWEKSNEVDEAPVVAADQAETDASEKKKAKSFDFATKRKTRPRSYDAKSNRRRHPSGRSDATKTATTRGGEDGKQQPQDVTNVFKAPIGQSVHSQDSGFSSGDESFLNFGEEDLFDEECRPNPISQRVVMSSSMNSSFGSIDSFADTPEFENKVLIEVPVDP